MVNHVVARDELYDYTLELARKIAKRPAFSLKLAKLPVNQALDAQGFQVAQQAAFSLQQVGHAHTHALALRKEASGSLRPAERS